MKTVSTLSCFAALFISNAAICRAADSYWNNPGGGNFSTPANWTGGVPGPADTASFPSNAAYQVSWTAPAANSRATFTGGTVTQAIGGFSWLLTNNYIVGQSGSGTGRVVQSSGTLIVTNSAGDAKLIVGQGAKGSFALSGGVVTVDYLFSTNNGTGLTNSIFTFSSGTLNTRRGAGFTTVGSVPLAIGDTAGQTATWNITGGSNYAIVDASAVVLGYVAGSHGVLNVSGTNTYLLMPLPYVGYSGDSCRLVVSNGAKLRSSMVLIGYNSTAGNATTIVTGAGSSWTNLGDCYIGFGSSGNSLIISNGARFRNTTLYAGFNAGNNNNSVIVSGSGSSWTNTGDMQIGSSGSFNSLLIESGARVESLLSYVGFGPGQVNNSAAVNGVGSVWKCSTLHIGFSGSGSRLDMNGGTIIATNTVIGRSSTSSGASLVLSNGFLTVTNIASAPAILDVRRGSLIQWSGAVTADRIMVTNVAGTFSFNGGRINTKGSSMTNGTMFSVGDGVSPATLNLVGGGHTFTGGLYIAPNASLVGTGNVVGAVLNYGTIAPGNSAGTLGMKDPLQMGPAAELVIQINGPTQGTQYDLLLLSSSFTCDGNLRVALAKNYTPSPANTFTPVLFLSSSGSFANVANGSRLKTTDNRGSFLVTFTSSSIVLSDYQSTDTDGDDIEDAWAQLYFGSTPLPAGTGVNDRFGDKDGDGANNYAEFLAGTDPTDAASCLKLTAKALAPKTLSLEYSTVPGRTYQLWYSTDLRNWVSLPIAGYEHPTPGVNQWTDDGLLTGNPPSSNPLPAFYRVSVE